MLHYGGVIERFEIASRPELRGRAVLLRGPRPRDRADRAAWGRHPDIARLYGVDAPGTGVLDLPPEALDTWFADLAKDPLRWVIEAEETCVGQARLHTLDEHNRRVRFGIGLFAPELFGRGLGTEATRLLLRHAFETLKMHRVDLRVLASNRRAIRCYEKCGFVHEGLERDTVLIQGEWHSDVTMSILEDEYRRLVHFWTI
jgi:ribosomal-protein-alanine N-acetyltransferase